MRNLHDLSYFRVTDPWVLRMYGSYGDHTCGVFAYPSPIDSEPMRVIASSGGGWDHVSVSRRNRCPNWLEMEAVKRAFFRDDETAFQLHVPESEHINHATTCLHLWRPLDVPIPRPPSWMVGPTAGAPHA